ncbi:hypothetical protein BJV74DRAFT_836162 [Russula compacta]|nr:hypothetical protein BJV74DRAFT_836162 [Russula compacta]
MPLPAPFPLESSLETFPSSLPGPQARPMGCSCCVHAVTESPGCPFELSHPQARCAQSYN